MAYIPNPDNQPGKKGKPSVDAIENQVHGGQPLYGTGRTLDSYGRRARITDISFRAENNGIIGTDKELDGLIRRPGVSSRLDALGAGYRIPAIQAILGFGLTRNNSSSPLLNNSLYSVSINTNAEPSHLKRFIADSIEEYGEAIAVHPDDNHVYHITIRSIADSDGVLTFEKINKDTTAVTSISLSGVINEVGYPYAMVYSGNDSFILSSDSGLFRLTTTGVLSTLTTSLNGISGLAYIEDTLYAVQFSSTNLYIVNQATWTYDSSIELSAGVFGTVEGFRGLARIGNYLYANVDFDGSYSLMAINENTGELSLIIQSFKRFASLACDGNSPLLAMNDDDTDPTLIPHNSLFVVDHEAGASATYNDYLTFVKKFTMPEYEEDVALARNSDDSMLYRLYELGNEEEEEETLKFEKIDTETFEVTEIPLSGYIADPGTFVGNSGFISDGGNDMYDGGNYLYTNHCLSQDPQDSIPYSHTKQSDSGSFVEIADGAIPSGYNYFGTGSAYFTNMYNGMFVLAARNIDITEFTVRGNVGADGSGSTSTHDFTIMSNSQQYAVFTKSIYNASDPSVNHFIIVPGDGTGLTHTASNNTDDDFDQLTGLAGINRLYYFVVARANGLELNNTQKQAVAQAFMDLLTGSDLSADLAALNAGRTSVTSLVPNLYSFSDFGLDGDYINVVEGILSPKALTYVGNDTFICIGSNGLYSITSDGEVSVIDLSADYVYGLAFMENKLYGLLLAEGFVLCDLDMENGQQSNYISLTMDNLNYVTNIFAVENVLYANVEVTEGETTVRKLATIDTSTGVMTAVKDIPKALIYVIV